MTASKSFASHADVEEKQVSFTQLSEHAWAYTAEGDPNTGIVIGDDAVLVADTQATPAMAQDVVRRIREVTDKPIKYVVLTHYHAVRVLGASGFNPQQIISSQDTYDLIVERGEQDKASEIGRFPRLFSNVESVPPGMTWPTMTFTGKMTLWLGKLESALRSWVATPGRHRRLVARNACCSAATWSSSTPRRTPATLTSRTGRRRLKTSPRSSRPLWFRAAVQLFSARSKWQQV
jgi:hypothetical protein